MPRATEGPLLLIWPDRPRLLRRKQCLRPSRWKRCSDIAPAVPPGCPLKRREFQCACRLAEGLTYKQIALRQGVALSTVRTQLHHAYRRLNVPGVAQLIQVMITSGWMDAVDTDWQDGRLTAAQSLYLAAFERWLRDPSEERTDERAFWLRGIFHEANITPPWEVLGTPQATGRRRNLRPSQKAA